MLARHVSGPFTSFSIDTTGGDGYDLVTLGGELDLSTKPTLDAEFSRLLSGEPGTLIVDLRRLTFIDSSGIHSLVVLHQDCQRTGRPLRVVRGTEQVMRVLSLCGLDSRLVLDAGPQAAIAEVRCAASLSQSTTPMISKGVP